MKQKTEASTEATTQPEGREAASETLEREIWEAQPLSPGNTARLIRLLAAQLARKVILRQPELAGASDEEIIVVILEVLDERSLIEFLSIAVDHPPEVIEENYDVTKAMTALFAFFRLHNFGAIWGEARRAAGAGQPRKKKKRRKKRSRSASKK